MSRHQDFKNAQAALNGIVGEFVDVVRQDLDRTNGERPEKFVELVERWDEFERCRNDLDGPGAASARRTSINAANAKVPRKGSMRRQICEVIAAQHREFGVGMTCDALEHRLRKPHQTVSPAVNEMERLGWIRDSGQEQDTRHGQPAIMWEPTEKLIDRLREIELGGP